MEAIKYDDQIVQKLVLDGDISKMTGSQRIQYYQKFCDSLGLNPLTQPFQIIKFQGKERLYATKDCTEQLRKIHGVSITDILTNNIADVFVVTAKACDKIGKTDCSTGAVSIKGLSGDALANALMKAETKAKRRVTLSICGLGILDESETDTMKGVVKEYIAHEEMPPVYPKESANRGLAVAPTKMSDEDLEIQEMWVLKINECKSIDELKKLYDECKSIINNDPFLFKLKEAKKIELS